MVNTTGYYSKNDIFTKMAASYGAASMLLCCTTLKVVPSYVIGTVENITDRKLSEDRLRENEALLRGLFVNLPDFVIVVDQNAKILFANHDAPGATKAELVGSEGFGFIDVASKTQCREAFALALSTNKVQQVEALDVFGHLWSCTIVPLIYRDVGKASHGDLHRYYRTKTSRRSDPKGTATVEEHYRHSRTRPSGNGL